MTRHQAVGRKPGCDEAEKVDARRETRDREEEREKVCGIRRRLKVAIAAGATYLQYPAELISCLLVLCKEMTASNGSGSSRSGASGAFNAKSFAPMVAGLSGGCVSTCLLLPLDNIKVRMQVNEDKKITRKISGSSFHFESIRIFRGILRHEGVRGLYQGLGPALVGSGVSWGGYFFLYEGFKKQLRDYKEKTNRTNDLTLTSMDNFKLACAAGAVMVGLTNPLWLIKLRIQLQMKRSSEHLKLTHKPYTGMADATRTIIKEEGFLALYKGAGPALLLTSHGGVQFVCYEFLKRQFHYSRPVRDTSDRYQSVLERLEKSVGFLSMGAISKM